MLGYTRGAGGPGFFGDASEHRADPKIWLQLDLGSFSLGLLLLL